MGNFEVNPFWMPRTMRRLSTSEFSNFGKCSLLVRVSENIEKSTRGIQNHEEIRVVFFVKRRSKVKVWFRVRNRASVRKGEG